MSLPEKSFPADTSGSQAIVVVAWLFPILASLFVVARFCARHVGKIEYGADDWVVLAALLPVWGQTAVLLITVYNGGMGHEYSEVPDENRQLLQKCLTILPMFFGSSLGLAKTSIVLLLIRIFPTPRFKMFAIALIVYLLAWSAMSILVGGLTCIPLEKSWNPDIPGQCADLLAAHTAISSLDIVGDILIIMLPMHHVWRLQRDVATKILLSVIFGLGAFDIVCGVLLIIGLSQIFNTDNLTRDAVNAWIWTILEPSVAVIIACAPSLKPLWRLMMQRSEGDVSLEATTYRQRTMNSDVEQRVLVHQSSVENDVKSGSRSVNTESLNVAGSISVAANTGREEETTSLPSRQHSTAT